MNINNLRDSEEMDVQEQNIQLGWEMDTVCKKDVNPRKGIWNEIVYKSLQLAVWERGNIRLKELKKDILNNTLQNNFLEKNSVRFNIRLTV